MFGSVARGEAGPDSDIDIMVELTPEADALIDVYAYVGIVNVIGDMVPTRVDVSERAQLRPHVKPGAERDAVFAF